MHHLFAIILSIVLLLISPSVRGQQEQGPNDAVKAELLGKLVYTTVDIEADGAAPEDVFDVLEEAMGAPIIGRYVDERSATGIDPELEIYLQVTDQSALNVLEMVLDQCTLYIPVTWQLRNGFIEVGTKDRLGSSAAAERRIYNIRDLMLEPPYFPAPDNPITGGGGTAGMGAMVRTFENHPYRAASLSRPNIGLTRASVPGVGQVSPHELALQIVQGIVQMIEQGNWDWGQHEEEELEKAPQRDEGRAPDAQRRPPLYRPPAKMGTIRVWREMIIIKAPDFMQRQVGGYPDPIAPAPIDEATRRLRNEEARGDGVTVTVKSVGSEKNTHRGIDFRALRSLEESREEHTR